MNWIILVLLAITSRATYSVATKVLSKNVEVSAITQSLLLLLSAGILSLFISPFMGGISFEGIEQYWFSVLLMIVSISIGNILYFVGIKKLDSGITQIAFSTILIWGALLSVIFLGSVFSIIQIGGMVLMLIAILMVQYSKGSFKLNSSVSYIIGSAVLFAVFQVVSAEISKTISTGAYLLMVYLAPVVIIGSVYYKRVVADLLLLKGQVKKTSTSMLFSSVTSLLYFIFSYLAYGSAVDSGVVVVMLTAQVVLSVIFGIIFLKEKENQNKKILAGLLAFMAGVMIKG